MANDSFRIDLDEVEAAAKLIGSLLDDLAGPLNQLDSVVKQIKATAYGSDLLGKSLTGGTSSVGGMADHQDQVLAGIRAFQQNSAAMAHNLVTMCQQHRQTDDLQAAELRRILDGGAPTLTATVNRRPSPVATVATAPTVATPTVNTAPPPPAPAPAPAPAPDSGFQNPAAPNLDYNKPAPKPDPAPHGGGGHQLLI